jgi:hypothetical protein
MLNKVSNLTKSASIAFVVACIFVVNVSATVASSSSEVVITPGPSTHD